MRKFLKLIEENRPEADTYTVELGDADGEVVDSFEMWGTGSPPDAFDAFRADLANKIEADKTLSKFLRLVDEYGPNKDKYTVKLKDFKGDTIPEYFFEVQGTDDFQEFIHDQFDEFKEDWGAPIPVEDQEGDPAEAIVAGMEGGTQAVQRRKSAESGVLQTYNNETQQLFNLPSKM